jgi:hypothetical protein
VFGIQFPLELSFVGFVGSFSQSEIANPKGQVGRKVSDTGLAFLALDRSGIVFSVIGVRSLTG